MKFGLLIEPNNRHDGPVGLRVLIKPACRVQLPSGGLRKMKSKVNAPRSGDLILYDKFGGRWESNSPSDDIDDHGIGVVVSLEKDSKNRKLVSVMMENGAIGDFAECYIRPISGSFRTSTSPTT